MFKHLVTLVTLAAALQSTPSFACHSKMTDPQVLARKAHVLFNFLEATGQTVDNMAGVEFSSFPTHLGMRGDCGALVVGTTISVQWKNAPGCINVFEYTQTISRLFGTEPDVRWKDRICN